MTGSQKQPPLIAHIIYALSIGGLENGLVNIINRMPPDRYRHVIICLSGYDDFAKRIDRDDVCLFSLSKRPGKDLDLYRRCFNLLRELKPDIVHTRNLTALEMQLPAFFAGVSARVHSEHGWGAGDPAGNNRKNQLIRKIVRPFVKHYIPLSAELEGYLRDKIGVDSKRLTRICNGVDTRKFSPATQARSHYPETFKPQNIKVIGAIGRMDAVKDPLILIKAFVLLLQRRPELKEYLRLVWIGDGSQLKVSKEALTSYGLDSITWFPGSRHDVACIMRGFNLYVLSSLSEGISNTLMEAMATGLPAVATNVGGNAELVSDGETGMLVEKANAEALADAMNCYIESPDLCEKHGAAGRKKAEEKFSLDSMVTRYMGVYDRVLGEAGKRC
ncbi:MAG: TIGR03088 family PEP-CTERM/XrtA system glycosyltransferase [Candidatus Polarisedimenticolaceae bacterium]|nr:TIGR03088 family PEP-CTERM/XrtA system glycosyltransferase [Candidatus Polarisedimenticolaceae bacterium]